MPDKLVAILFYFSLPGANHLQLKFNSKMQDVKRVLDLNCKQKED